jgi:hypothetical protein
MKRRLQFFLTVFVFIASSIPSAFAADTSAPQLVDWALTVNKADISKTDATVTVRFIISDDSEIASPNLLLKSLSTTQMTSFATVKELSRLGKLVSYEASATIKFGQSPKTWEWVLYPLRDVIGNSSTTFGPGSNWRSQISVVDAIFTDDLLQCEGVVKNWNFNVERLQSAEKKYSGAQEFAVLRLQFRLPIELLNVGDCQSDTFRLTYMKSTSPSNLLGATTNLANALASVTAEVADRFTREMQIKQEAEAKVLAEQKAKQDAEAKAAAELKGKQDADAKVATTKKSTITCTKGKLTKKVTAIKPKCPSGYKVKK